ncbi:hypothetical protein BKA70DRAFT_650882 [Coprinopsis sp. MPI-PUGE-AT-0042]|nr:hypothetical protein BKA70DRAFT_650882 [Coprinopsis sp. MPI-PUGE-AT-0042]
MEHATPTKISDLKHPLIGKKLRIAGRFLSYDAIAGSIVLLEGKGRYAVYIDISAAVDDRFSEWVNDRLTTLIVIGYLESSNEPAERSDLPAGVEMVDASNSLQLRALLVVPAQDLDLKLWDRVIEDLQRKDQGSGEQ